MSRLIREPEDLPVNAASREYFPVAAPRGRTR
jgi:hypothetical protein